MTIPIFTALGKFVAGTIYTGATQVGQTSAVQLGGWIGTAIGAVTDAALIAKLTQVDPARSDRRADAKATTRDEGAPVVRAFGRKVRVPGHYLWQQWPRTYFKDPNKSGKGVGGGAEFITDKYRQSVAVEWCRTYGHPVARVLEVIANGESVWKAEPNFSATGTLSTTIQTSSVFVVSGGTPPTAYYYHYVTVTSPNGGPDLGLLKKGKLVQINGFADADMNSGSLPPNGFEVIAKKTETDGTSWVKVLIKEGGTPSANPGAVENNVAGVTVFQSQPAFSKKTFADVTHYFGTTTQGPDPEVVLRVGAADAGAYRGSCYSVFEQWQLEQYGNAAPQAIEAILEVDPNETVQTCVDAILDTAGIVAGMRDTSALAGIALEGYIVRGRTSAVEALAPLMAAYNFVVRDTGGVLTFTLRANLPRVTIPVGELAARARGGSEPPHNVRHVPTNRRRLPAGVQITYLDPARNYETGSRTYRTEVPGPATAVEAIDVGLVLASDDAQELAMKIFWTRWANSHAMEGIALPPSRIGLRAGTVLKVTDLGREWEVLTNSVTSGANEVIEASGVEEQVGTLTPAVAVADPPP